MIILTLLAAASLAGAAEPRAPTYEYGMELRSAGKPAEAKEVFLNLLEKDPRSGAALEGLTLTSLSLKEYEEALGTLERWRENGDSAYIESLEARVLDKLHRRDEATEALVRSYWLDTTDVAPMERADDRLRADAPGLFPFGKISKSLALEELSTPNPQRIAYEGRSGGAQTRFGIRGGWSGIAGVAVTQTAQRNDTRGFTYFDILEQVYSAGLEDRWKTGRASAQYGQAVLSDNKGAGVGRLDFSRVQASAEQEAGPLVLRGFLERAPFYLRGAGGNNYFALLREGSARVEAEAGALGMQWLGRAGIYDYSEGSTYHAWSLLGTKEIWGGVIQPTYSHSYRDWWGAGADGRYDATDYDRLGIRARFGPEGYWRASASGGLSQYRDANRADDADAEARVWLPWWRELSGIYRFHIIGYRSEAENYQSIDERGHWAGAAWRRHWGRSGPWTEIEYTHGFLNDPVRNDYQGNAWVGLVEWYRGRSLSFVARGRLGNTSLTEQSYSASLQARWTF